MEQTSRCQRAEPRLQGFPFFSSLFLFSPILLLSVQNGQAGVRKASVTIVFNNADKANAPMGYEKFDQITVTRQVTPSLSLFFPDIVSLFYMFSFSLLNDLLVSVHSLCRWPLADIPNISSTATTPLSRHLLLPFPPIPSLCICSLCVESEKFVPQCAAKREESTLLDYAG